MKTRRYGLFEAYGIELEYMIVDLDTLDVRPLCDIVLKEVGDNFVTYYDNGLISWSNELVNHVIELKTNGPVSHFTGLDNHFHNNIIEINSILKKHNAMLLPGGVHPWMDPYKETVLWQHDLNEIYELYNRIFDCRGHGWSNLQSSHINLSFSSDDEFGRLHAAIRLILPLIPALSSGSPILNGKITGVSDNRLEAYIHNQDKIPSLAGIVIPEMVYSEADYYQYIFDPIKKDIEPYNNNGILDHHFLNSRGAIARFDRGAIEIRILDVQESPAVDIAILDLIQALLKQIVNENFISYSEQKIWNEKDLFSIFLSLVNQGENAVINNEDYLNIWGLKCKKAKASEVWQFLIEKSEKFSQSSNYEIIKQIVQKGSLSTRITKALKNNTSYENQKRVFRKLAESLENNEFFLPD